MGQWSLPPEGALEYEHVLKELEKIVGERAGQLLRGGIWREFFARYPESNHIHKRMCMISRRVHEANNLDAKKGKEALIELWKGQCNDAYWHGIFGGLYLPHLRSSLYRCLLRAETLACDILNDRKQNEQFDFDFDGYEDVLLGTDDVVLAASEKGGCLTELSLRKQAVNILDIITRRPEAYHAKIAHASSAEPGDTRTIHDQLTCREAGLSDYLVYDKYRRASLLDHFFPLDTTLEAMAGSTCEELGDFIGSAYSMSRAYRKNDISLTFSRTGFVRQDRMELSKKVDLSRPLEISVEYLLAGACIGLFAVEMNLSLLGSPYALIRVGGKTLQMRSMAVHEHITDFIIEDRFLRLTMKFSFSEPVHFYHYPVETVSLSEQGVERLYQGTSMLFGVPLQHSDRKTLSFTICYGEETI
jgi:alpha-amylase